MNGGFGNEHSFTIVAVGLVFVFALIFYGVYLDYKRVSGGDDD